LSLEVADPGVAVWDNVPPKPGRWCTGCWFCTFDLR